jgi:pimeloyl-ACP methyl ester carboxylesterase
MVEGQTVQHRTAQVDGLSVFYREAGDPANPKLLLLGGFPASSHQFRNLIPALAERFHVLSPDYPEFGNTDMPADFAYSFDRLSEIVEGLLERTGFHPFGLYHQDYGGPIGSRIVGRHPDWLEWQVIQNSNAYEEGFTAAWDGIRHALWVDRSAETEAPLLPFLELDGVKLVYTHGHRDPDKISPDNWNMDLHFLERPGARKVQLDLLYDYRTNVALYPQWQAFLRERPAEDADPLGRERHLLHSRGRPSLPARPAGSRAAHARQRPLRGRGLARGDRRAHQALPRREGRRRGDGRKNCRVDGERPMRVLSVNVGLPREVMWRGNAVTTGIYKQPVTGRVPIRALNLDGDHQADLRVHGGRDKAVYAYPSEFYELRSRGALQ